MSTIDLGSVKFSNDLAPVMIDQGLDPMVAVKCIARHGGLAIAEHRDSKGPAWTITHERSGKKMPKCQTRDRAGAAALMLALLALPVDWTQNHAGCLTQINASNDACQFFHALVNGRVQLVDMSKPAGKA